MRRPLVGMALCVVAGMGLGALGFLEFKLWLLLSLCLVVGAICRIRSDGSQVLLYCVVASLSAAHFAGEVFCIASGEILAQRGRLPREQVGLIGEIVAPPRFYALHPEGGNWSIPIRVEGLEQSGVWERRSGTVLVRLRGAPSELEVEQGMRLRCCGHLRECLLPGKWSLELEVQYDGSVYVLPPSRFSFRYWSERVRRKAAKRLSVGIERYADQLAVYQALLLGYRQAVPDSIIESFSCAGALHIFAISGLHVGIAGTLIGVALRMAGVSREKMGWFLIPVLGFYLFMTGMKTSATRAWLMAAIYFAAPLFRRRPDTATAVACSAIVLLLGQPRLLRSIGFAYSFIVVAFILMVFSVIQLPVWTQGSGAVRRSGRAVFSLGLMSSAAFVGSTPLTLFYFGLFVPVSLLANFIVVPLAFGIVLAGWLSILLPFASELFNFSALAQIDLLLSSVEWMAFLPGGHMVLDAPPLVAMGLWYAGWSGLLVHARHAPGRILCGSLVLMAIIWTVVPPLVLGLFR